MNLHHFFCKTNLVQVRIKSAALSFKFLISFPSPCNKLFLFFLLLVFFDCCSPRARRVATMPLSTKCLLESGRIAKIERHDSIKVVCIGPSVYEESAFP